MISAIVLAAGRAQRMGEQKLFLPFRGKPVLQWVIESALAADVREVICVVRDLTSIKQRIRLVDERLMWLVNNAADRGQSSSVIAGLWAIEPQSQGALFLVADQPMMSRELINRLLERFRNGSALIVAPSFAGQPRNPVLFRRELFPELLKLTGDHGGRLLLEQYRDRLDLMEWHEETPFVDIDVREDYERLVRLA
ncbi:MAG TPA: nucleotidyltransferase family protein [Candidatus Binatia bacterium]